MLATLIKTCKLHGVNPEAYLADVLTHIATTKSTRLTNPCPWVWAKSTEDAAAA